MAPIVNRVIADKLLMMQWFILYSVVESVDFGSLSFRIEVQSSVVGIDKLVELFIEEANNLGRLVLICLDFCHTTWGLCNEGCSSDRPKDKSPWHAGSCCLSLTCNLLHRD